MMTLDEAIKHCEEVIEELEKEAQEWHENQVRKCKLIPFAEMDYTHENDCIECARDHKQLAEWLKELKQLREQTRWTPCSERLPKENEYVGDVCKYYLIQDEYEDMYVAHLSSVGWIPINSLKAISDEVIAWRPSPQPYRVEKEDKE